MPHHAHNRLSVGRRIIQISLKLFLKRGIDMKYFLENSYKSAILISVQNAFRMQNLFIMEFLTFVIDKG